MTASPISSDAPRKPVTKAAAGAGIDQAIALARELQARATELQTTAERRQQAELDRMLQTPADKSRSCN